MSPAIFKFGKQLQFLHPLSEIFNSNWSLFFLLIPIPIFSYFVQQEVLRRFLFALRDLHSTPLVHKPRNTTKNWNQVTVVRLYLEKYSSLRFLNGICNSRHVFFSLPYSVKSMTASICWNWLHKRWRKFSKCMCVAPPRLGEYTIQNKSSMNT